MLKALFRFIREIWLRDRTFRQFVRDNLSLIVTTVGFVIMTLMFIHVYFIVLDQEDVIAEYERTQSAMKKEIDEQIPFLTERMNWYRDRYYELKSKPPAQPTTTGPPVPKTPPPKQPEEKPTVIRPPNNDLVERWKKLSQ
ncbi:hypothetical protein D3C76_1095540 [compost metagenome]